MSAGIPTADDLPPESVPVERQWLFIKSTLPPRDESAPLWASGWAEHLRVYENAYNVGRRDE
ncbi:hypothetical protein [Nevskia ramosa]|uniref:hypothetical protein n=1 Tax=Nevskia ramosa TaxID=64002 RepID=UPI003D096B23